MSRRRYHLICNPVAGRKSAAIARRLADHLTDLKEPHALHLTTRRGEAFEWAVALGETPDAVVIAIGGDGTVNEIVNGLAGTSTPLGLIRAGSVNVTARELGIPRNPLKAFAIIRQGRALLVPVGRIDRTADDEAWPREMGRRFLMMAGMGLDAEATRRVRSRWKAVVGPMEYALAGLRSFWTYSFPPIVCCDSDGRRHEGISIIASNIRLYGGNVPIAPDGDIRQDFFNVSVFQARSRWTLAIQMMLACLGRHIHHRQVDYFSTRSLTLEAGCAAPLQIDGDYAGALPHRIVIEPASLRLIAP